MDRGCRDLNAAKRMELFGMDPHERFLKAHRIKNEAKQKLREWRQESVMQALHDLPDGMPAPAVPGTGFVPDAQQLYFAQEVIDQQFDNVYMRLEFLEAAYWYYPSSSQRRSPASSEW